MYIYYCKRNARLGKVSGTSLGKKSGQCKTFAEKRLFDRLFGSMPSGFEQFSVLQTGRYGVLLK